MSVSRSTKQCHSAVSDICRSKSFRGSGIRGFRMKRSKYTVCYRVCGIFMVLEVERLRGVWVARFFCFSGLVGLSQKPSRLVSGVHEGCICKHQRPDAQKPRSPKLEIPKPRSPKLEIPRPFTTLRTQIRL